MKLLPLTEQNQQKIKSKEKLVDFLLKQTYSVHYSREENGRGVINKRIKMKPTGISLSQGMGIFFYFPNRIEKWFLKQGIIGDFSSKIASYAETYFDVYLDEVYINSDKMLKNTEEEIQFYVKGYNYYFKTKDGKAFGKQNLY